MSTQPAKALKFLITANIEKVKLCIVFPVEMVILWKRGSQKIETKNKIIHSPRYNESIINEELSMFACFQYNENNTLLLEKKTSFSLIILTPKAKKIAGTCTLNLADFINKQMNEIKEDFLLEKCPDKTAKLTIRMKFEFISEVNEKEMLNQSGISSKLSEPTSLVDESFRNFSNDVTFSNGSTSQFIRNEKPPLKEQSPNVYNKMMNSKENNNEIACSLINSIENFKSLNHTTSEILFLKRKISEKNEEISKVLKNFEEFKKNGWEIEEKVCSLEALNKNLVLEIEREQNERKELREKYSELLLKHQNSDEENKALNQENINNIRILHEKIKQSENERSKFESKSIILQQEKNSLTKQIENIMKEKAEMMNFKEKIDKYENSFEDFSVNLEKAQSEINLMKQNQAESDKNSESLRKDLEKVNSENRNLKNLIKNSQNQEILQEEIEKLRIKSDEDENLLKKYQLEIEKLKDDLEKKQIKIENLMVVQKEFEKSKEENKELIAQAKCLHSFEEEIVNIKQESMKTQKRLVFTEDLLKKYENELEKTRKELENREKSLNSMKVELESHKSVNNELKLQINDSEEFEQKHRKLERNFNFLKGDLEKQKAENSELKKSLNDSKSEQIILIKELTKQHENETKGYKKDLNNKENDINVLQQENQKLIKALLTNSKEKERETLEFTIKKYEFELETMKKELENKENIIINSKEEIEKYKCETSELRSRFNKTKNNNALETEINFLREEIQSNQRRLTTTDDLLKKYEEELDKTKKKLEKKRVKIDNLNKSKMMDSGFWNEDEKNHMLELEEINTKLKGKNQKLKEKIKGFEKENEGNVIQNDNEIENSENKGRKTMEIGIKDEGNVKLIRKIEFSENKSNILEEKIEKIENYYLLTQLEVNKYESQNEILRKEVKINQKEIGEIKAFLSKANLI